MNQTEQDLYQGLSDKLRFKLEQLPDSPGVYRMYSQGELIYVGKAISLKNRVRQYFHDSADHAPKVRAMVERIDDFEIILCDSEMEALVLECTLIKRHRPFYNILLKDDKQYPYIRIDLKQDYPTVELARRIAKDGAKYFGPYIGATVVRDVLDMLHKTFPLRNCKKELRFDAPPKHPGRPCLRYQMGLCLAPCQGGVLPGQYAPLIEQVVRFLEGGKDKLLSQLRTQMQEASAQMEFERAAMLRDRIRALETMDQTQKAENAKGGDWDVLCAVQDSADVLMQALFYRGGALVGSERFTLERANATDPETMEMFLLQYYDGATFVPREVFLSTALTPEDTQAMEALLGEKKGSRVYLRAPQRGEKAQLVLMARKNAEDEIKKRNEAFMRQRARTVGACEQLAKAIGLDFTPRRIEGYDISNTQGTLSVASMVVMIDGRPAKDQYRHYRIKTVVGPNDFASMAEVISRRFTRGERERLEALERGETPTGFADLPDLVLIDGGPEQLAYALDAIHSVPMEKYPAMFGLAKRFEEIYLPGRDDDPICLDHHSEALRLIQRLRDEAHRFAITHHKKLRGKQAVASQLEALPGIGPSRRRALLTHFRNMDQLKLATLEEILAVEGMSRPAAETVFAALHAAPVKESE